MILLFYYSTLQQNHALMMSLCMSLHFSGERGKYHCDESALLVTKKERAQERQKRISYWVFVFALKTCNNMSVCFSSEG